MKNKKQKTINNIILFLVTIIVILFWNSSFVFPIKLFVVLLHEISHGIIAILTGGSIKVINVSLNLGGVCVTKGGNNFFIALSGYLGSLLWGTVLFITSYDFKQSKIVTTIFAAILVLVAISFIKTDFGLISTLLFSAILYSTSRVIKNKNFHLIFTRSIAFVSLLSVVTDIKEDLFNYQYRLTDSQNLEIITGINSFVWGIIWLSVTLLVIFFLIKKYLCK